MMYLSIFLITLGILELIYSYLIVKKNKNYPVRKKVAGEPCILIPARNESQVIEELLISIENQTKKIKPSNVYVIVEDKKDPTIEIVKKHKMNIVFRKNLNRKRKGYALDDAVKEIIKSEKKYCAYFIFDADNILDSKFIETMYEEIEKGYDIGIGYRNTKNGDNLVSCSSALTFSLLNTLNNERRKKYTNTIAVSGTGFYIKGEIIDKLKGYPFNSLTEDYELTLYAILNNLTTTYNTNAIFYDEQPENFKLSIIQRTRWVKGYFEARNKYIKKIAKSITKKDINYASKITEVIGVNPLIHMIIGFILLLVHVMLKYSFINFINILLLGLLIIYLSLAVITYILLKKEEEKLNLKVSKYKIILYNPIFLASFIICFIKAVTNQNIEWKAIPHSKKLKI